MADIEVKMCETAIAKGSETLTSSGIGSCVVTTLYDSKLKIGAMAHAMLPSRDGVRRMREQGRAHAENEIRDTKYIEIGIDEMLKKMLAQGSKREDLEAKIAGGANMFPAFESDIGRNNVLSAEEKLKKEGKR